MYYYYFFLCEILYTRRKLVGKCIRISHGVLREIYRIYIVNRYLPRKRVVLAAPSRHRRVLY